MRQKLRTGRGKACLSWDCIHEIEVDPSISHIISDINTIKNFESYASCSGFSSEHTLEGRPYLCWEKWTEEGEFDDGFHTCLVEKSREHDYYIKKGGKYNPADGCVYLLSGYTKEGKPPPYKKMNNKERKERWEQLRKDILTCGYNL